MRGAATLLERLPAWLDSTGLEPVLVHGDLWGGNAALLPDGRGAIFDPAVYRGDREVDLAMAQLFGGFPPAFFEGYQSEWPLEPAASPHEWRCTTSITCSTTPISSVVDTGSRPRRAWMDFCSGGLNPDARPPHEAASTPITP